MSTATQTMFEVRVRVKAAQAHYSSRKNLGAYIIDGTVQLFHFPARTPDQAFEKGKRYGQPVSVRKVSDRILGDIEHLKLEQPPNVYVEGNPYNSALHMDEMIWNKRNSRRENLAKDKPEA